MPEELDREAANAREDGYEFDRGKHLEQWRERGWPGLPSPSNALILHVGRLWWSLDDLELAQQVSGLEVPASRAEGILMRLGMANRHWRDKAEEERKRGG